MVEAAWQAKPAEASAKVQGFSVSAAMADERARKATPMGQIITAVESLKRKAAAVCGACERLEELCRHFEVTDIRSPDFLSAGMSLLQARSHITQAINSLRVTPGEVR
jgi:hypothetical protein